MPFINYIRETAQRIAADRYNQLKLLPKIQHKKTPTPRDFARIPPFFLKNRPKHKSSAFSCAKLHAALLRSA